ncbi:MAG: SpoIIE family protein phosphatase [Bacteroidia bacterium]|nr:SpoIIE family protein phosphatase [Bacteroidia bacterium]
MSERKIIQPAEILNHLNKGIIESLGQSENENNDGMDAVIISIDKKNNELHYAGANRPLWIVRGEELIETKPDKLPLGGVHIEDKEFSNHEIQLQKNDLLYLFTDGYADQFGGILGKKLMTKKFKEVLISIRELPMKKQREFLENYLSNWKDKFEQVDDILVMGIKVE